MATALQDVVRYGKTPGRLDIRLGRVVDGTPEPSAPNARRSGEARSSEPPSMSG